MSHISKIELVIHSLEDLKEACRQLGFEFMKNQKTYNISPHPHKKNTKRLSHFLRNSM